MVFGPQQSALTVETNNNVIIAKNNKNLFKSKKCMVYGEGNEEKKGRLVNRYTKNFGSLLAVITQV